MGRGTVLRPRHVNLRSREEHRGVRSATLYKNPDRWRDRKCKEKIKYRKSERSTEGLGLKSERIYKEESETATTIGPPKRCLKSGGKNVDPKETTEGQRTGGRRQGARIKD